ncbi:hypothetical protein NQ318_016689 [Aromia moschata]|uniref:Transmembrane protein n=1 Tax=Aromia moschata TaxID=1265417 RepID=A0AAV8Y1K8_9CUCU|nr:hypothetical protein NQ318_016689 [Aromia moschata]
MQGCRAAVDYSQIQPAVHLRGGGGGALQLPARPDPNSLSTLRVSGPRMKFVLTVVWSDIMLTVTSPSLLIELSPNSVALIFGLFLLPLPCFTLLFLFVVAPALVEFFFLFFLLALFCFTGLALVSVAVDVEFVPSCSDAVPAFEIRMKEGSLLSLSEIELTQQVEISSDDENRHKMFTLPSDRSPPSTSNCTEALAICNCPILLVILSFVRWDFLFTLFFFFPFPLPLPFPLFLFLLSTDWSFTRTGSFTINLEQIAPVVKEKSVPK